MSRAIVFIVGPSGSGKSMTFANFPQDKIVYYDIERKGIPFAVTHPQNFRRPATFDEFRNNYKELLELPPAKQPEFVIIDSLTHLCTYAETQAATEGGTDQWGAWRLLVVFIRNLFEKQFKNKPWSVICTNIDENVKTTSVTGDMNIVQRRAMAPGKKWEGMLESQAMVCAFTKVTPRAGAAAPKFELMLEPDGVNSAKCPPVLEQPPVIRNDQFIDLMKKLHTIT